MLRMSVPFENAAGGRSMRSVRPFIWAASAIVVASSVHAGTITVNYTADAGGNSAGPLNGLSALAKFVAGGDQLEITLQNTSTGLPADFDAASSLLVSIGFQLPGGVLIQTGNTATIAAGSVGIAQWSSRSAGGSVGDEWAWTNIGGGDLLSAYAQVISTSSGNNGLVRFDGGSGSIDGPWGGIVAKPPLRSIPGSRRAVSDAIVFTLTLTAPLSDAQLSDIANQSIVEFGSDARYLRVPEPAALALLALGGLMIRRRPRTSR